MNKKEDNIDIFFVGGGTAGHVLPNIFLIQEILQKSPSMKIGYIGSKDSIEKKIFLENFPNGRYFEINSDKLRRYLTLKHIFAPFKIFKGFIDSLLILKKHKPKLIFTKGGFVCAPVVFAAYLLKIKIFIHESDYSIGLTNKISMPLASKIGVSFQKTIDQNKKFSEKMQLFGPIFNKKIFEDDNTHNLSEKIIKKLESFKNQKKTLLIFGGSLGSQIINNLIYENYEILLESFNIIHICGKNNINEEINNLSENLDYILIENIPHQDLIFLIKFSDIIISRAGINSVFELMFFKKNTIFIPLSKQSSRGDQIENAEYFSEKGVCEIIFEEDLNIEKLFEKLECFKSEEKSKIYKENFERIQIKFGNDEIIEEIYKMIYGKSS